MSTLIVIAKECVPGRVKTRLTPPLTPQQGARIAAASLHETLAQAAAYPVERRVLYFDGSPDSLWATHPEWEDAFEVIPQVAGDLDVRLGHIFDTVRERWGNHERTALIGMDTPQVTTHLLREVFEDTGPEATWLGLTKDGGYWLIGMREPRGDVIRGVPMSRDDTGQHQLQALVHAGLTPRLLPELTDMDHWADALDLRAARPETFFASEVDVVTEELALSDAAAPAR